MYAVLGAGGLGALVALGLLAYASGRRRVPFSFWIIFPLIGVAIGNFGTILSASDVIAELGSVSTEALPSFAKAAYGNVLLPDWMGRWTGAVLLAFSAWMAGLGGVIKGDADTVSTWIPAGLSAGFSIVGGLILAAYSSYMGLGPSGLGVAAVLTLGGLGVAVGSTRRHAYEHAFRLAGMRFSSALCLIIAASWAGQALVLGQAIELSVHLGEASTADYVSTLEQGLVLAQYGSTLGAIAFVFAWLIAVSSFFSELGDVVQKVTVYDMAGATFLLAGAFVTRQAENYQTRMLKSVSDLEPMAKMVEAVGYDLPVSQGLIAAEEANMKSQAVEIRPQEGGFGDVLVYIEKVDKIEKVEAKVVEDGDDIAEVAEVAEVPAHWERHYRWNGKGWTSEVEPLSEIKVGTAHRPLIVARGDLLGGEFLNVLSDVGGKGLLLLRQSDVEEDLIPEAASRQGILLPVELAESVQFKDEMWTDADENVVYEGPIRWYGENDDRRKFEFGLAAMVGKSQQVMHMVVGERARVRDLVRQCLPALVDVVAITPEVEGDPTQDFALNQRRCVFSAGDAAEVVEAAAAEWDLPKAVDGLRMSLKVDSQLDKARINTVMTRELGAFSYCASSIYEKAKAEHEALIALMAEDEPEEGEEVEEAPPAPEPIEGKLILEVAVKYDGQMGGFMVGERSEIEDPNLRRCVSNRLWGVDYGEHPEPEVKEDEEAPELPTYTLSLTYK